MELKPCPFCGGETDVLIKYGRDSYFAVVQCSICSSSGKAYSAGTDGDDDDRIRVAAIRSAKAWNMRVSNDEDMEL